MKPLKFLSHTRSLCLVLFCALSACDAGDGMSEAEYLQRAEQAVAASDVRTGIIELKNALQQNPDSLGARWLLGQVYLLQGDGSAAEKELRRALQLGMPEDTVTPVLGQVMLIQGRHQELLDRVRVTDTMSSLQKAEVLALYGQAHIGLMRPEAAETAFEAALQSDPLSVRALLGLAQLRMQSGHFEQAGEYLERALALEPRNPDVLKAKGDLAFLKEDYAGAETTYRQVLEIRANRLDARLGMSHALIGGQRLDEALGELAAVLKVAPRLPQANYLYALASYLQQDYANAASHADKVLNTLAQEHLPSLLIAGAARYALGEYQQAHNYLTRFLEAQPQHDGARKMLAATQLRLDRAGEAAKTLAPMAAAAPDDVQLLSLAGTALIRSGDLESGKSLLKQAIAVDPQAVGADTRALLGAVQLQLGERAEGLEELEGVVQANPDVQRADLVLILEYLREKQYDQALAAAQRLRTQYPENPIGHTLTGIVLGVQGHEADAVAAFTRALEVSPGNPNAALNLAAYARKNGDQEQERRYYQAVLDRHPEHLRARILMAVLEERSGRRPQAIQRLIQLAKTQPTAVQPPVLLGRMLLRDGQSFKALEVTREALARHPDHPELLKVTGLAQLETGEIAQALATFQRYVAANPKTAEAHVMLAGVYERMENWSAMEQSLQTALAIQPQYPLAQYAQARALLRQQKLDAAGELLAQLSAADPDNPIYAELQGDIALTQQRYKDAVDLFVKALARHESGETVSKLVRALWGSGAREQAVDTLDNWLDRHPEDTFNRLFAGSLYLNLERLDAAAAEYQAILQQAPDNLIANNNMAWIELQQERLDKALDYAQRARSLSPSNPEILDTLGMVLLNRGDLSTAVDTLTKASSLAPDNADIQLHLASALTASGRTEQARKLVARLNGARLRDSQELQRLQEQLDH